jgi:hypothetical protein
MPPVEITKIRRGKERAEDNNSSDEDLEHSLSEAPVQVLKKGWTFSPGIEKGLDLQSRYRKRAGPTVQL